MKLFGTLRQNNIEIKAPVDTTWAYSIANSRTADPSVMKIADKQPVQYQIRHPRQTDANG